MNREIVPPPLEGVFAVLYDAMGTLPFSFRRDRWLGECGKLHVGDAPETELYGAGLWVGRVGLFPKSPSVE